MAKYSIAKVIGDLGFVSQLGRIKVIEAKNYNEAVNKATRILKLKKGDKLSIIRLGVKYPITEFGLPGRYEYRI